MEFQKKKYTFRGLDGYAGFRHGQEYELELGESEPTDDALVGMVIVNPVSRRWMHATKSDYNLAWGKISR